MRWPLVGRREELGQFVAVSADPGLQNETFTLRGASGVPNFGKRPSGPGYPAGARSDRSPALLESWGPPWHRSRTR
jgi:hypothetical protein